MAFVTDRSTFLDTVTDAIEFESSDPKAQKMIELLAGNTAFLLTIPALLNDKDHSVRSKTCLALGNLIASDNNKMSTMAFGIAKRSVKYILNCFEDAATVDGAAYVVHNIALRLSGQKDEATAELCATILDAAKANIGRDIRISAARDLLYAIKRVGSYKDAPTAVLLKLIRSNSKSAQRIALDMLADQISEENFDDAFLVPSYDCLRDHILSKRDTFDSFVWRAGVWAFANLMTEDGMADRFVQDEQMLDKMIAISAVNPSYYARSEAAWSLVNATVKGTISVFTDDVMHKIYNALHTFQGKERKDGFLSTHLGEAIREAETLLVDEMASIMYGWKRPFSSNSTNDVPMEIDSDAASGLPAGPMKNYIDVGAWAKAVSYEDQGYETYDAAAAAAAAAEMEEEEYEDENYAPSAMELLAYEADFGHASPTVCSLIDSVARNNNAFTPIPETVTLTVADLRALECRGFIIVRGALGINPLLTTAFNAL